MSGLHPRPALPKWFWPVTVLGLAWNLFGIIQFLSKVHGSDASLMRSGLTQEQAELYISLPLWMDVSFALGVFGGALGSIALMLRMQTAARLLFALSLAAYGVLFVGDITQGVFAAVGAPQVMVLALVVAIAAGLLWVSFSQPKPIVG